MLLAATTVEIMFGIFWIFPKNSLTELLSFLNQLPSLQIPINKNKEVKFKANFNPLLLIKIYMEFGSKPTIQV